MYIVNVEGAINKDGRWLIIMRSEKEEYAGGTLALVGGKCEVTGAVINVFEETLKREVQEEVGIEITNLRYVNSSSFFTDTGIPVIDIVFLCEWQSGEPFPKSPDEVDEVFWLTTDEILTHQKVPDYLKANIHLAEQLLHQSNLLEE